MSSLGKKRAVCNVTPYVPILSGCYYPFATTAYQDCVAYLEEELAVLYL